MKRLVLLLAATVLALSVPAAAAHPAAVPSDPRVTAAVEAWTKQPLYVDPRYSSTVSAGDAAQMLATIRSAPVPVFVAVVPTGEWFQEKGDTRLLAGWLATANRQRGVYVVMEGRITRGVDHLLRAYAPSATYGSSRESMADQLREYLAEVKVGDQYELEPARTEPLPPRPERTSPPERFTVGKALGNGLGGVVVGLMGGALLAGVVLAVSALTGKGRGGPL